MRRYTFLIAICATVAGCDRHRPPVVPERFNVEISGSPECLAIVSGSLMDFGISSATIPEWSRPGFGSQQFGPVEVQDYAAVKKMLKGKICLKGARTKPCSTPLTDVRWCYELTSLRRR